jgi:hypothetical protein
VYGRDPQRGLDQGIVQRRLPQLEVVECRRAVRVTGVLEERDWLHVKLPIKASKHSPGGDAFGIFMGTWTDDGDRVPEDPGTTDDQYDCQPPYTSFILIHGGTPPGP